MRALDERKVLKRGKGVLIRGKCPLIEMLLVTSFSNFKEFSRIPKFRNLKVTVVRSRSRSRSHSQSQSQSQSHSSLVIIPFLLIRIKIFLAKSSSVINVL